MSVAKTPDAPAPTTPVQQMRFMAREALDGANGDEAAATDTLFHAVVNDEAIYELVALPLVRNACNEWIRRLNGEARRVVRQAVVTQIDRPRVSTADQARATAFMLRDYPLAGGVKLGDATREEIARTIDLKETQSATMLADARWLRLVAQSLPPGARVRDAISEERLIELRREAQNEIAPRGAAGGHSSDETHLAGAARINPRKGGKL